MMSGRAPMFDPSFALDPLRLRHLGRHAWSEASSATGLLPSELVLEIVSWLSWGWRRLCGQVNRRWRSVRPGHVPGDPSPDPDDLTGGDKEAAFVECFLRYENICWWSPRCGKTGEWPYRPYRLVHMAALWRAGQLSLAYHVVRKLDAYAEVMAAAARGRIDLIEAAEEVFRHARGERNYDGNVRYHSQYVLAAAISGGKVDLSGLRRICAIGHERGGEVFRAALAAGRSVETLEWCLDVGFGATRRWQGPGPTTMGRWICPRSCLAGAAAAGHIHVMAWMYDEGAWPLPHDEGDRIAADNAARGGHVGALEWLLRRSEGRGDGPDGRARAWLSAECAANAAAGGHVRVIEWLLDNDGSLPLGEAWRRAVGHGRVEVLSWASEKGLAPQASREAWSGAVDGGKIEALRLLRSLLPPSDPIPPYVFEMALGATDRAAFEWLCDIREKEEEEKEEGARRGSTADSADVAAVPLDEEGTARGMIDVLDDDVLCLILDRVHRRNLCSSLPHRTRLLASVCSAFRRCVMGRVLKREIESGVVVLPRTCDMGWVVRCHRAALLTGNAVKRLGMTAPAASGSEGDRYQGHDDGDDMVAVDFPYLCLAASTGLIGMPSCTFYAAARGRFAWGEVREAVRSFLARDVGNDFVPSIPPPTLRCGMRKAVRRNAYFAPHAMGIVTSYLDVLDGRDTPAVVGMPRSLRPRWRNCQCEPGMACGNHHNNPQTEWDELFRRRAWDRAVLSRDGGRSGDGDDRHSDATSILVGHLLPYRMPHDAEWWFRPSLDEMFNELTGPWVFFAIDRSEWKGRFVRHFIGPRARSPSASGSRAVLGDQRQASDESGDGDGDGGGGDVDRAVAPAEAIVRAVGALRDDPHPCDSPFVPMWKPAAADMADDRVRAWTVEKLRKAKGRRYLAYPDMPFYCQGASVFLPGGINPHRTNG